MKKHIGFLFKLIHDDIETDANRNLKELGLTLSQIRVLGYLHNNKDKTTYQKDIEAYLEVSHPTVVGILKRLEAKGFVIFELDKMDKRMKIVKLASKESFVHDSIIKHHKDVEAQLLKNLTEEEIDQLTYLLIKIYKNIKDSNP